MRHISEIVRAAVRSSTRELIQSAHRPVKLAGVSPQVAIDFACDELRDNFEFVMVATTEQSRSLRYARPEVTKKADVKFREIYSYGSTLKGASRRLRNNYELVMTAVSATGFALKYASKRLKNRLDIVMAAVSVDGSAIEFCFFAAQT